MNNSLHERMDKQNVILEDLQSLFHKSHPVSQIQPSSADKTSSTGSPQSHFSDMMSPIYKEKDTICIKASVFGPRICSKLCSCQCHTISHYTSPRLLYSVLGSLFVGSSGVPMLDKKKCNRAMCKSSEAARIQLSYYFPKWLIAKMVYVYVTNSMQSGPSMSLRIVRVLPDAAPIFTFARKGDILGMRSLFHQGIASPVDVADGDGRSALHMALYAGQSDMARFLIGQNADCEYEDKYFISAVGACWEMTFQNTPTLPPCVVGKSNDDNEFLNEFTAKREYNGLHKIVLGLANVSIEDHLGLTSEDINSREASGRTALHWAAVRGDLKAVRTLIAFGADLNALSNAHWSPLHSGSLSNSPEVLELLVRGGAKLEEPNNRGDTALSIVALVHDNESFLDILSRLGANIHTANQRGETLLHRASIRDNTRNVRWLIAHGIDANKADNSGCTALHQCIRNGCHKTLAILLEARCYVDTQANNGRTILHDAAAYGDLQMLTDLFGATLDFVDPDTRDFQDMTAEDVFNTVRHENIEEDEAQRLASMRIFIELMKKMHITVTRSSQSSSPTSEKNADLNEFFDANERMESGQSSLVSSVASL